MKKSYLKVFFLFLFMSMGIVSSLESHGGRGGGGGGMRGGGMSRGGGMRGGGRQFNHTGGMHRNVNRGYGNRNYYGRRGYGYGAGLGLGLGLGLAADELYDGGYYYNEDEDPEFYDVVQEEQW